MALISQATLHDDKETGRMDKAATLLALTPDRDPLTAQQAGHGCTRMGR
jgi:hypothetical protein